MSITRVYTKQNKARWKATVYREGRRFIKQFVRKIDAEQWQLQIRSTKDLGQFGRSHELIPSASMTFAKFSEENMRRRKAQGLAPSTLANYESDLKYCLLPILGQKRLVDASRKDADAVVDHGRRVGRSAKTINDTLIFLSSIFQDAVRRELIKYNPFRNFERLKETPKDFHFLRDEEMIQFLKAIEGHPHEGVYLVAILTGMRRGEIFGLQWDKINWGEQQITVARTLDRFGLRETTKGRRTRVIPMTTRLTTWLSAEWDRQGRPRQGYVFLENEQPMTAHHFTQRHFKKMLQKTGITSIEKFHDLRHSFASFYMMKGGNLFELQKLLGHRSIETTQRYAHLAPGHLRQQIQRMDALFDRHTGSHIVTPVSELAWSKSPDRHETVTFQ